MKLLRNNITLIKNSVLENSSGFIDLKSLAARVHLKLPSGISSKCTRQDVSDFIINNCFAWGIAVQDGHRLILSEKGSKVSSSSSIMVECQGDEIKIVGGYLSIDAVIEECGFATVFDVNSGSSMIVTRDLNGKLVRSEGNYWPENDGDNELHDS